MKRFILLTLIFCILISMCSCTFDESKEKFKGGELLDNEKISEIKDKLLSTETEDDIKPDGEAENTSKDTEIESNTVEFSEITSSTAQENTPSEATEAVDIVYWLKGGQVWHTSSKCHYLNGKEYTSGTENDAIEAGKTKLCSSCGK